jgi:hypothetical protein
MTPSIASGHIRHFTAWANALAQDHGRPHEMIPQDPDGAVTLTRFRRTLAWFVHRRPGGRVALGIQYGHLTAPLAESYGGRSRVDMLQILDLELALATADSPRPPTGSRPEKVSADLRSAATSQQPPSSRPPTGAASSPHVSTRPCWPTLACASSTTTRPSWPATTIQRKHFAPPNAGAPARSPRPRRATTAARRHIHRIREEISRIDEELATDGTPLPVRRRLQQRRTDLEQTAANHHATATCPLPPENLND